MNEQNKTNEDPNSNLDEGMQLLHDVIQSNVDQITTSQQVLVSNEALVEMIGLNQDYISEINELVRQQFHVIDQEQQNRKNFLASIPKSVQMEWNKESRDQIDDINRSIAKLKKIDLFKIGALALTLLVISVSCYFSLKFYEKSILSKTEIREEIIAEIYKQGQGIYNVSEIEKLKSNAQLIQKWIERNPRDSKPFLRFKERYRAK